MSVSRRSARRWALAGRRRRWSYIFRAFRRGASPAELEEARLLPF